MAGPLQQTATRKPSTAWSRLKPTTAERDPLESMGFPSKGDTRLLDPKTQESYYNKIVARYMQFCTSHSKDLDSAFASLSLGSNPSDDPARNPPTPSPPSARSSNTTLEPSAELSILLLSLRKLREALLSTTSSASNPSSATILFAQRCHIFSIRLSLLAHHPPSYYPSLPHLLFTLHRPDRGCAIPQSELKECWTYLILDVACRGGDLGMAYALRESVRPANKASLNGHVEQGYDSRVVDKVLDALVHDNFIAFWRIRSGVDGYVRAILDWAVEGVRRQALKCLGRAYLGCDVRWVLKITRDEVGKGEKEDVEVEWEKLVREDGVGWGRERERVVIRRPKEKALGVNGKLKEEEKRTEKLGGK